MPLRRTHHVIDEGLQAEIRAAYQKLTDSLDLVPRWGQRQMIAEVANALADPDAETPIAVVEAGTGTGKTIAYLVAALPIARKNWWWRQPPWHCRNNYCFVIFRMS